MWSNKARRSQRNLWFVTRTRAKLQLDNNFIYYRICTYGCKIGFWILSNKMVDKESGVISSLGLLWKSQDLSPVALRVQFCSFKGLAHVHEARRKLNQRNLVSDYLLGVGTRAMVRVVTLKLKASCAVYIPLGRHEAFWNVSQDWLRKWYSDNSNNGP